MWIPHFFVFDWWLLKVIFTLACSWLLFDYFRHREIRGKILTMAFLIFLIIFSIYYFLHPIYLYHNYAKGDFTKYYLPPQGNFYLQQMRHLVVSFASHFIAAGIIAFLFWLVMKLTRERLIDLIDVGLITYGALLIGWPSLLIFLAFLFVLVFLIGLVMIIAKRGALKSRFIITPFIPVAIILAIYLASHISIRFNLYKIGF